MLCRCGETIDSKRVSLGYSNCLECGAKSAMQETLAKQGQVVSSYHKGGFQYVSPDTIRDHIKQQTKAVGVEAYVAHGPAERRPERHFKTIVTHHGFYREPDGQLRVRIKKHRVPIESTESRRDL